MNPIEQVEVLRAACCVAGINHRMKPSEAQIVNRLADKVGVGRASLEAMIERATNDDSWHEEQFRVLKTAPQETMTTLFKVAMADGELEPEEIEVLKSLSVKLGIEGDVFAALIEKARQILATKAAGSADPE